MRTHRIIWLTIMVMALLLALTVGGALAGGRPLSADLTGAAEVPGPGDPDGSGSFSMTVNPGQGEICYTLTASDIAPATAAHIHVGTADVAGPVVVGLTAPTDGASSACVSVARELATDILKHPEQYYVNVHNAEFPPGAIRGQLSK
jgi:hypothetical protein